MMKSPSSENHFDAEHEHSSIFGGMLVDIAQEAAFRDKEKNNGETSCASLELCLAAVVAPPGKTESVARLDASLSSATNTGMARDDHDLISTRALPDLMQPLSHFTTADVHSMNCHEGSNDYPAAGFSVPAPKSLKASPGMIDPLSLRAGPLATRSIDMDLTRGETLPLTGALVGESFDNIANTCSQSSRLATDVSLPAATSEPIFALPIHVTTIESHLPAMMIRTALDLTASAGRVENVSTGAPSEAQKETSCVKILNFDVHPVALGSLTVRMRIVGKQIDIAIEAHSEDVRAILTKTKVAMIKAFADHGLMIESPDIRLTSSQASTGPKPATSEHNAQAEAGGFTQDQGHARHDERNPWSRHRSPIDEQSGKSRGDHAVVGKRIGFYL